MEINNMSEQEGYLKRVEAKLRLIVSKIGWNYDEFLNSKDSSNLAQCPLNLNHRVPVESMEKHLEQCLWRADGYKSDEESFPESVACSSQFIMTPSLQTEIIEKATGSIKNRPVPKTSDKLVHWFSSEERLALYDHVVANTERKPELIDYEIKAPQETNEEREMSALELAAVQRDAKRRRATYRHKVHTSRKTHTEILREVIETQLNTLTEESKSTSNISPSRDVDNATVTSHADHPSGRNRQHRDQRHRHDDGYSPNFRSVDKYHRYHDRSERRRDSYDDSKSRRKRRRGDDDVELKSKKRKKEHKKKKKKKKHRKHSSDHDSSSS